MRTDPDALMVFAAGRGTRMAPLTDHTPKPLIRVAGRALIDHALDLSDGVSRVVVNTHHLADQIAAHLAGRNITLSHEPALLETGGGLRNALPLLGSAPLFTLNSDAVWRGANPLAQLRAAWDLARMDALLLLVAPAHAHGHAGGDFVMDDEGRLTRGPGAIYTGAQIIDPALLDGIEDAAFSLNRAWDPALARGRVFGLLHDGEWCDVGRPENIAMAEAMLSSDRHV